MKASELIGRLVATIVEYGDIDVLVYNPEYCWNQEIMDTDLCRVHAEGETLNDMTYYRKCSNDSCDKRTVLSIE